MMSVSGCSSRISIVSVATPAISSGSSPECTYLGAALERELLTVLARLVEVAPVEDELGTETPHRRDLDRVRLLGDADRRLHAEQARGEGDRLTVVAGRRGHDAALPLARGELGDEIDSSPNLEGPDRLVVLVLDEDLGAEQIVEGRVPVERRRPQMGRDPPLRLEHVGESWLLPGHRWLRP